METRRTYSSWFLSLFVLPFFCFSTHTLLCFAGNSISPGQSLSSNQTIISQDGTFELGFFKPGTSSPNYYIGTWYKNISLQNRTYVWVANRNNPLSDPTASELKLLENGNLVLLNQSKIRIWSTDSSSSTMNSSELVLGNDGNLVLRDGLNPSVVLWQSFDHPTDTLLPGGRLKYDNITKRPVLLTSWKNSEDPAEGIYSLQLDPIRKECFIFRNRTTKYWSSGSWNGEIFSSRPEMMKKNYIYKFSYVSNENESYFTFSFFNESIISRFSRTVMDLSGQIKQLSWLDTSQKWNQFWTQPLQRCQIPSICGAFGSCDERRRTSCQCLPCFEPQSSTEWNLGDTSGGCTRKTSLQCGDKYEFLLMSNMKVPEEAVPLNVGSAEKCKLACSNNCSCNAYSYHFGCSIWNGDLLSLVQLSGESEGRDLYIRLASSEVHNIGGRKKRSTTVVMVGVVAGVVACIGLVLLIICTWKKRHSVRTSKTVDGSLVPFTYKNLQNATKNFSDKLGGGGFGSVFKGTLHDSSAIAVKKLEGLSQGEKEFRTEVSAIGTKQHVNLVRLCGFCSEGTKRLLIYDYMPNGSLDSHLFQQQGSKILDWKTRYQIALGTARGLNYLHEKCRDCIIHCDIKPENILLDADFCPKVADFGLAKLVGREFSRVLTTMRGTRGYLAPEWISGVAITAKADVYSYGMMLFELISGRRNSEKSEIFFPTWAASRIADGKEVLTLLDKRLDGEADVGELTRAFRAACWCIQDHESHRPSMGQVVQILEGVLEAKPPPIPTSLQDLVEHDTRLHFFFESSLSQSSGAQTTTVYTPSQNESSE